MAKWLQDLLAALPGKREQSRFRASTLALWAALGLMLIWALFHLRGFGGAKIIKSNDA